MNYYNKKHGPKTTTKKKPGQQTRTIPTVARPRAKLQHLIDYFPGVQSTDGIRMTRARMQSKVLWSVQITIYSISLALAEIGRDAGSRKIFLMPLSNCVGDDDGTYAYAKRGVFWGFANAPRYPCCSGRYIYEGVPSFTVGDVVGCGVNLATRQLIYTKNGERLDTANLFVVSVDNLFPCVSMCVQFTKIEANFGPNFKFNIADAS
uniref:B30.2/SPRY domain-containing protein n=1 Tax=Globodera rostochiensis TaxID=31243 RepID=A0A914HD14_GLORO